MKDIFESLKEVLEDRNANKVIRNAPMAEHTSYKTGGKADFLLLPESEKDLKKLLGFLKEKGVRTRGFFKPDSKKSLSPVRMTSAFA